MTVAEFLDWPGDGSGRKLQLVDGEPHTILLGNTTRGTIHTALAGLISTHLNGCGSPCYAAIRPPITPRVRASINLRLPALAVTATPGRADQHMMLNPMLLIEILSPGNTADTWDNVWSYTTIPSVREIAVVHSTRVLVELLRRDAEGHWPPEPEEIGPGGTLRMESIGYAGPLADIYAQTHLA
jgi:Uma2 family endonuclease